MIRSGTPLRHTGLVLALVAAHAPAQDDVATELDSWLASYFGGELALDADAIRSLETTLGRATARGDVDAARRVLAVAAVGLDRRRYHASMLPTRVRMAGDRALPSFGLEVHEFLLRAARGQVRLAEEDDVHVARRCAALRALGAIGTAVFRPALERQLAANDPRLRLAAAESLYRMASAASLQPVTAALAGESSPPVQQMLAEYLRRELRPRDDAFYPPHRIAMARAAGTALGRSDWRADRTLVALLGACRQPEGVEPLIRALTRCVEQEDGSPLARPSDLLRHDIHRTLVALTGRSDLAAEPSSWRYFWSRAERGFEVPTTTAELPSEKGPSLFGIPIEGSRVVFALDLSGSMGFSHSGRTTRLDVATASLRRALRSLPEHKSFGLMGFAERMHAWRGELLPATRAHRTSCTEFLDSLAADGGTNTWGALSSALRPFAQVYGSPANLDVDEIFVISDGIPTVGAVIDAQEILQLVAATNRFAATRIHAIYLAPTLSPRDLESERNMGMRARDFMRQLARQNGGSFREQ